MFLNAAEIYDRIGEIDRNRIIGNGVVLSDMCNAQFLLIETQYLLLRSMKQRGFYYSLLIEIVCPGHQ